MTPPLRLSRAMLELQLAGFDCAALTYRKVWEAAVERRIRAHQIRGVWHFELEDVRLIGAALGLPLARTKQSPAGKHAHRATAAVV